MTPSTPYSLIYAPITKEHLKAIERKYYPIIRDAIIEQLQYESDVETRNRKPLKRPIIPDVQWEVGCGLNNRFRIFYRVEKDTHRVFILSIGEKRGASLWVAGKEVES